MVRFRQGGEDKDYQTMWSEDELLNLLLESLGHDERVKEAVGEIAIRAVDREVGQAMEAVGLKSSPEENDFLQEIEHDEELEEGSLPVVDMTAIHHEGVSEG